MLLLAVSACLFAQDFNSERNAWANYIQRMYKAQPFEGVRLVDNEDGVYLISVLSLDESRYRGSRSTMYRVASTKAMSQANSFFNEPKVSTSTIIRTREDEEGEPITEEWTSIIEKNASFVKGLELIRTFKDEDGRTVFIYASKIEK